MAPNAMLKKKKKKEKQIVNSILKHIKVFNTAIA